MKKRLLPLLMALLLCLTLIPATALAAEPEAPTDILSAKDDDIPDETQRLDFTDDIWISFHMPQSALAIVEETSGLSIDLDWSINSESDWKCSGTDSWSSKEEYGKDIYTVQPGETVVNLRVFRASYESPVSYGFDSITYYKEDPNNGFLNLEDNTMYLRLRFRYWDAANTQYAFSPWSEVFSVGEKIDDKQYEASDWAQAELAQAAELGLIPEVLQGADLRNDITRAEFAAVAVKVYESLSSKAALPIVNNPFTDTKDVEVLKAYNIGAVNGTSATTFSPNDLLNREQAATMLTRVFKAVTLTGWTLETDSQFTLSYTKPAAFADDAEISAYAKDSVYFMAANNIVGGVGNNMFAPKNTTDRQTAEGYANATREQALLIAVRMVKNLGE